MIVVNTEKLPAGGLVSALGRFLSGSWLTSLLLAFFVLCLASCVPVVYEVIVPSDVYESLEENEACKTAYVSELYGQNVAKELFSCEKYSIVFLDQAAAALSPSKPGNVFVLGRIFYQELPSAALSGGEVRETALLSVETERRYLYPCLPFSEDMPQGTDSPELYELFELSAIPGGSMILPVSYEDRVYLADDSDYPLYKSTFLKCEYYSIPDIPREAVRNHYEEAEAFSSQLFQKTIAPAFKAEISQPDVFFIAAVGDIILCRGVQESMIDSDSAESVFTDTLPILKNNDFTIGNLEGAVTARTENAQKTYTFKFKKAALPYLKDAGFDYLMLTNNHCYDYGEDGFKDTLEAVAAAGFATSGAGLDKDEAAQFYRTQLNGHELSILSFGAYPVERSGFNGKTMAAATEERAGILWESDELLELIRQEKARGGLVIVNIHGGSEYVTSPTKSQRTLYEKVCEAGADVVFGSHPHVLQPVEWFNDSLIAWSLGNFVFPGMDEMPGATDTMILRLGFVDGRLLYYEKYPAYIDNTAVRLKKGQLWAAESDKLQPEGPINQ